MKPQITAHSFRFDYGSGEYFLQPTISVVKKTVYGFTVMLPFAEARVSAASWKKEMLKSLKGYIGQGNTDRAASCEHAIISVNAALLRIAKQLIQEGYKLDNATAEILPPLPLAQDVFKQELQQAHAQGAALFEQFQKDSQVKPTGEVILSNVTNFRRKRTGGI